MIRATIDTNIAVSGLLFGGLPLKIIEAALTKQFIWVTSPPLMEETERVLCSDKFGLSSREIQILTKPLFEVVEIVLPLETIATIARCPADNRVLECAVAGKCSVITTGDRRDLLSLKHFRTIEIINAREFLSRLK